MGCLPWGIWVEEGYLSNLFVPVEVKMRKILCICFHLVLRETLFGAYPPPQCKKVKVTMRSLRASARTWWKSERLREHGSLWWCFYCKSGMWEMCGFSRRIWDLIMVCNRTLRHLGEFEAAKKGLKKMCPHLPWSHIGKPLQLIVSSGHGCNHKLTLLLVWVWWTTTRLTMF